MGKFIIRASVICALCAVAPKLLAAAIVPTFYILQEDTRFVQTGPSTTTSDGFTFQGRATPNDGSSPIGFDGGTLSFPAPSPLTPQTLTPSAPNLVYSSGKVNQTTFQTNFPSGTYTFNLTDSTNPSHTGTEAIDSSIGVPVTTTPTLTAASFTGLQGLNTAQPFTVNWNAFSNAGANALIFFAVQDSLGNTPIFDGLQPNVTQDTIPANALTPGTAYNFFLFFTNNAFTADNNGQVTTDGRTSGAFTTLAVPEPATASLALLGFGVLFRRRRC